MKFGLLTAAAVLSTSMAIGVLSYCYTSAPLVQAEQSGDTLAWLRREFKLSEEQYRKVAQLHEDYGKICSEHCLAIQEATTAWETAQHAHPLDPEKVKAAESHRQEMVRICEHSMEAHLREVAACMPEKEGARYLTLVLSRIGNYDHSGPPSLSLKRP